MIGLIKNSLRRPPNLRPSLTYNNTRERAHPQWLRRALFGKEPLGTATHHRYYTKKTKKASTTLSQSGQEIALDHAPETCCLSVRRHRGEKPWLTSLIANLMCPSPWISTWNQHHMEIRTFWTIQPRFIHPTVPIRLAEPCTGLTRVRPEWSFGWNHDQTTELTVPELVFPDHLDILGTIVEPDLAWVMKNLKTYMDSHRADIHGFSHLAWVMKNHKSPYRYRRASIRFRWI